MSTVSIGSVGGVVWENNINRYKGVFPKVHRTLGELIKRLGIELERARTASTVDDVRFTLRTFVAAQVNIDYVRSLQFPWNGTVVVCEAVIPIKIGYIVYFGGNTPKRQSSMITRSNEWMQFESVEARVRSEDSPQRDNLGFTFDILTSSDVSTSDVEGIVELYHLCYDGYMVDFTVETISKMLNDNIVAIARDDSGKIVCIGQAERVEVDLGSDGTWFLVEISENATHPSFRRRGLSQQCRLLMVQEATRGEYAEQTTIYSECGANHAGVVVANLRVGMKLAGRLDHHTLMNIGDAAELPQEGRYASLFVMYR